jgi:hypothetical protein
MCLAVYVASSTALPVLERSATAPGVYLEPEPAESPVRNQFFLPHVYYVGSHLGCGCGFSRRAHTGEDRQRADRDHATLASIARSAVAQGSELQLFACWEGMQDSSPSLVASVSLEELEGESFEFEELELLTVVETTD